MFINYSQTYAAALTSLVGMLGIVLPFFGIQIVSSQLEFVAGVIVNFIGIVWVLVHRNSQGGVSALGVRR